MFATFGAAQTLSSRHLVVIILRAARGRQSPDRDSGNRKVGEKTIYVKYVK